MCDLYCRGDTRIGVSERSGLFQIQISSLIDPGDVLKVRVGAGSKQI